MVKVKAEFVGTFIDSEEAFSIHTEKVQKLLDEGYEFTGYKNAMRDGVLHSLLVKTTVEKSVVEIPTEVVELEW